MKKKEYKVAVSDSIGEVSASAIIPPKATTLIVIAHGAGAGMNHKFMTTLAETFAAHDIGAVRYNLAYMEQGKKRPDMPAVAEKTIDKVLSHTQELFPDLRLFAAGKSFGGRMTSQLLSKTALPFVNGVIFFGFPLHPAGAPDIKRADHLKLVKQPMLFLQGTRDTLAELDLIRQVCKGLRPATLTLFEGADHSFKAGKKELIPELVAESIKWMSSVK